MSNSKVQAQVAGGEIKQVEASTVADVRSKLGVESGYVASVNGEPADESYVLSDYEFVAFAKPVKAG